MIRNRAPYFAWCLLLVGMCSFLRAHGQVVEYPIRAELQMDSVQSSYIAEWQQATLVLTNQSPRAVRCTPRAVVTKNGQILARTKLPRSDQWVLAPGESVRLRGASIFGRLILAPDPAHHVGLWQALPDTGMVSLCIHVTDSMGIEHFATPLCRTLTVFAYRLPIPLGPNPSDTLVARHPVTVRFSWLPVQPQHSGTCYVVRCFRLPDTLAIAEAVRIQAPLFEQRVCNRTELRWRPHALAPGRYVWSVQALDHERDAPIGSSDGYSLSVPFSVAAPPKVQRSNHHRHRRR